MHKKFYKHKILLDENMPQRNRLPNLNKLFDVKHVRDDLGKAKLTDLAMYEPAVTLGRVIVTYNVKHFRPLAGLKSDAGILGVPDRLPLPQQDTKLCAFLKKHTPHALAGKFVALNY
jgi:hypothetical protein